MIDVTSLVEFKTRMRLTRDALGMKMRQMSKLCGGSQPSTWSNYESENVDRLIDIPLAITLCQNTGLTLDWIYLGDMRGLSEDLRAKIIQLRAAK
jgi:transcriptional regulator with XRE-family HTH domain